MGDLTLVSPLKHVRLTTTQRDALTGLISGTEIYNTTTNRKETWNGTTWDTSATKAEVTAAQLAAKTKSGRPYIDGHSYTQAAGDILATLDSGGQEQFTNWTHLLGQSLGVDPVLLGHSGAFAGNEWSTTGQILRYHYPPHVHAGLSAAQHMSTRCWGNLYLTQLGFNDFSLDLYDQTSVQRAYKHGQRLNISRKRARSFFDCQDASITYAQGSGGSNGWAIDTVLLGGSTTIATSLFTKVAHGLWNGQVIKITGLVNTTGVINGSFYFVINGTADTFQLASTETSRGVGTALTLGGTADSNVVFETRPYYSKGKVFRTKINGNTFTKTLENNFPGGVLAIAFRGNPYGQTSVGTASAGQVMSGSFTLTCDAVLGVQRMPWAGTVKVPLSGGGTTNVTYSGKGTNTLLNCSGSGTIAAAGQAITMVQGATVTWSGTAVGTVLAPVSSGAAVSAGTATTVVGGQGVGGFGCHMVQRFLLTSADAGKTIIGTLSGLVTGEELVVDSVWYEDTDGPTHILVDHFKMHFASLGVFATETNIDNINAAAASVCTEFDSVVQPTNMAPTFVSLFQGAWVATDPATIVGGPGTGTGTVNLRFLPTDTVNCVVGVGSILRSRSTEGQEEILITGLDKTTIGSGYWQITSCLRNYTTAPDGQSASAAVTHPAGTYVYDPSGTRNDRIHPSSKGHVLIASAVETTLANIVQNANQLANSGGTQDSPFQRWTSGGGGIWQRPTTAVSGTKTLTTNKEWAQPFPVRQIANIVLLGVWVTTGAASATLRFCIYTDGAGCPGNLIYDTGASYGPGSVAAATTAAFAGFSPGSGLFVPLNPAILWVTVTALVGQPIVQAAAGYSPMPYATIPNLMTNVTNNPTKGSPAGLSRTFNAGTDWDPTVQSLEDGGATFPYVFVGLDVPSSD